MTYADAIKFLYDLQLFGARLDLENTFKLAELSGNPQQKLRFIHVAGTNGKGSTCAMLESIYRAAGLRVGLFTSPHLVEFGERIQVNRSLIGESDVARLAGDLEMLLRQFPADTHPTFFEVVTVMALRYFAEQKCDLVIWETGLGGRLDATNIVTPLASVITNIQFDHQQWLGDTLAKIAAEKAGIIKRHVPVVTAAESPEALEVIKKTAKSLQAPLTLVTPAHLSFAPLNSMQFPLLGRHQLMNAATALATARVLSPQIPVKGETLQAGLARVHWPGRLQLVQTTDGRQVLLDGAHNTAGAETLVAALKEHFPDSRPALILGILADKDFQPICNALAPLARRILTVPVSSRRTAPPEAVAAACRKANPRAQVEPCGSLREAVEQSAREPFLIVTGSLYLVGEAMEWLELSPVKPVNERGLNEWTKK